MLSLDLNRIIRSEMLKDKDLQKWVQNTTIEPSYFDEELEIEEKGYEEADDSGKKPVSSINT